MEKNEIEEYLKKLKDIDSQLNNDDVDLSTFGELDKIMSQLSENIKKDTATEFLMDVNYVKLNKLAITPSYAKDGDAGLDFRVSRIINETDTQITYGTDISMEIPRGYVGLLLPRSSIRDTELTLSNSVGVIDCVPSGTKIKTINGDINVEDLFKNPTLPILSYNEESNSIDTDIITDMWIVENKDLLKITTEDGDIIELPHEKEVFTKSGWKKVINLTEMDEILRFF